MNKILKSENQKSKIMNRKDNKIKNQPQKVLTKNTFQLPSIINYSPQSKTKNKIFSTPTNYRYLYNSNCRAKHKPPVKLQSMSNKQIGYHQVKFQSINQQPQKKLICTKSLNPHSLIRNKLDRYLKKEQSQQQLSQDQDFKRYNTVDYSYPQLINKTENSLLIKRRLMKSALKIQQNHIINNQHSIQNARSNHLQNIHKKKIIIEFSNRKSIKAKQNSKNMQIYTPWQTRQTDLQ